MTRRQVLAAAGGAALAGVRPGAAAGVEGTDGRSLAERLGYGKNDRLLMIHADDLGMCHSVNAVSSRALLEGGVSCASVMVPCPWFPEIAAWSHEHPEADLGLHLTLTSEWRYYRWRPVTPVDQVKGLVDGEGFLWRTVEEVVAHASPEEVETEIRAQVQRARQFGMQPTHVDSHMGTLFAHPRFFEAYVRVSKDLGLFPMLPGPTPDTLAEAKKLGLDYLPLVQRLESQGFIFIDRLVRSLSASTYEARKKEFHQFVRDLPTGFTELIVHLAGDDEEIRHISNAWENRWNEFRLLMDADTRALVRDQGVKLIGYRPLSELWRSKAKQ